MDMQSLIAANLLTSPHRPPMDARAEERYYTSQFNLPRPNLRLLGSIAMAAGVILLVVGI